MNIQVSNKWVLLFITLFLLSSSVYATPDIGIVKLYYSQTATKSAFNAQDQLTAQTLLDSLKQQLIVKVDKSNAFDAHDGESVVNQWIAQDSNIIKILESAQLPTNELANESKVNESQLNLIPSNNIVLIGWITDLTYNVIIDDLPGMNKKSVIYNLNLRAKYKLFDANTKRVILEFHASGHGGYSTIVPVSYTFSTYRSDQAVQNTLSTFVNSVLHGLLVRREQGFLDMYNNDSNN